MALATRHFRTIWMVKKVSLFLRVYNLPYDVGRKIITPPDCHCCCFILGVPKTTTHELWAITFDWIIQITTTHTVIISVSMRTLGRFFLNSCYLPNYSVIGVHHVSDSLYNCSDMITYWTITCTILTLNTVLFGTNINICIGQFLPDRAK